MIRLSTHSFLPALALLLAASCSRDDCGDHPLPDRQEISFEIGYAAMDATRVVTDRYFKSNWEDGDRVGLYIVKGSAGLQASGNWVDNIEMRYKGQWTCMLPQDRSFYPTDGDVLSFYAYYPYDPNLADPTGFTFSVSSDQRSHTALSQSDLLMASAPNVSKSANPVQLLFSHALAMVEVHVAGITAAMSPDVQVTLEGCLTDVTVELGSGATTTTGNVSPINMFRLEQPGDSDYATRYTYRALIPAQSAVAGSELFRFSLTQGTEFRSLSHKPGAEVAFSAGQVKPYDITLQPAVDPTHFYSVGDYYPHNGFPIIGIVFEVSNGGKNGKIISLDQIMNRRWGDPSVDEQALGVIGIRDKDDGRAGTRNLIVMHRDEPDFAQFYGLFNWVYQDKNLGDIDGRWYLPAINELSSFREAWNADRDGFNAKLTALGYPIVNYNHWYVSSTEAAARQRWLIVLDSGVIYDAMTEKDYTHGTIGSRAVSVF